MNVGKSFKELDEVIEKLEKRKEDTGLSKEENFSLALLYMIKGSYVSGTIQHLSAYCAEYAREFLEQLEKVNAEKFGTKS